MQTHRCFGLVAIAGLLCLLLSGSVSAQGGGPQIMLPETEHDFGSVAQGEKLTHTFIVKNVGDEPLKLIKAKGS